MGCDYGCRPKPPNRTKPRQVGPDTVARLWCKVLEKGYSPGDIKREIASRCPSDEDCDCEKIKAQVRTALTLLALATVAIGLALGGLTGGVLARIFLRFASAQRVIEHLEDAQSLLKQSEDVLEAVLRGEEWEVIIRPPNNP